MPGPKPSKKKEISVTEFKELALLKALSTKAELAKYKPILPQHTVLPETWFLLGEFEKYFAQYPEKEEIDFGVFPTWFSTAHSTYKGDKLKYYGQVIQGVAGADEDTVNDLLHLYARLDTAVRVRDASVGYINGSVPDLARVLRDILDEHSKSESTFNQVDDDDSLFVPTGAGHLATTLLSTGAGFKWSLEPLNVAFGPMHLGDFGCIMARPNGGKTTLLVQETLNFLLQMPEDAKAVIFNNEEKGEKLSAYAYKRLCKQSLSWIASNPTKADEQYNKALGPRKFWIRDDSSITPWGAEKLIERVKPQVVGLNVLAKFKGWDKEGDLEKIRKLYQWAREMAKRYNCIVLATHQADVTAEGQRYMTQNQLFGSKTDVQGELDVLIAVGRTHDASEAGLRFLSSCKNKQPTTPGMDPMKREGALGEVVFDGDTSSFSEP